MLSGKSVGVGLLHAMQASGLEGRWHRDAGSSGLISQVLPETKGYWEYNLQVHYVVHSHCVQDFLGVSSAITWHRCYTRPSKPTPHACNGEGPLHGVGVQHADDLSPVPPPGKPIIENPGTASARLSAAILGPRQAARW